MKCVSTSIWYFPTSKFDAEFDSEVRFVRFDNFYPTFLSPAKAIVPSD